MIKCVIIDDEKPAREALDLMLGKYFKEKVKVVALASTVKEGVNIIYEKKPDLVFLDIEMQGENGFELFNYFQTLSFSVIFTTAYKEYAIKAIRTSALDYLLKPVGIKDLGEAIARYEARRYQILSAESLDRLLNVLHPTSSGDRKVALPTFSGFQFEKVGEILYCEADQNYSKVFTLHGGELLVSKPLNQLQKLLPAESFYRIHKSHLVNLNYIKTYSKADGFHVVLENGVRLSVATRRNEDFVKIVMQKQ